MVDKGKSQSKMDDDWDYSPILGNHHLCSGDPLKEKYTQNSGCLKD